MKKGWVAMDSNGEWWWFPIEPFMRNQEWIFRGKTEEEGVYLSGVFNDIAPADDWKKSLIEVKDD